MLPVILIAINVVYDAKFMQVYPYLARTKKQHVIENGDNKYRIVIWVHC